MCPTVNLVLSILNQWFKLNEINRSIILNRVMIIDIRADLLLSIERGSSRKGLTMNGTRGHVAWSHHWAIPHMHHIKV